MKSCHRTGYTTEKTNQLMLFMRKKIAVYPEDNVKYKYTVWAQCRYSLLKWAVHVDKAVF